MPFTIHIAKDEKLNYKLELLKKYCSSIDYIGLNIEYVDDIEDVNSEGFNLYIANFGIGTKSPSHKLHVVGNTFVDGKITANELEITGSSTIINTDEYVTKSLHINSIGEDAISLKINHDSESHNIVEIFDKLDNQIFTINNIGNIAIGSDTYIDEKLNIDGNKYVHGSLNGLSRELLTNLES